MHPDLPRNKTQLPFADVPRDSDLYDRSRLVDLTEADVSPLQAALHRRDGSVLTMVETALRHRQAMLAFQPVVLARAPGKVAFQEGLIRLLDATGRVIPARDFVAKVETCALGRDLDCLALDIGLHVLACHPDLVLSLNMSARSIGYGRWIDIFDRAADRAPDLGRRLILEITELSAMAVPELVIDLMDRLRIRGVRFALDEFGAGALRLSLFGDFMFDAVKLDARTVRGCAGDADAQSLLRVLRAIAQEYRMASIATAVETAADAAWLTELGVDCLQGYHLGPPSVRPPWLRPRAG